jgi:hypothetical protein
MFRNDGQSKGRAGRKWQCSRIQHSALLVGGERTRLSAVNSLVVWKRPLAEKEGVVALHPSLSSLLSTTTFAAPAA